MIALWSLIKKSKKSQTLAITDKNTPTVGQQNEHKAIKSKKDQCKRDPCKKENTLHAGLNERIDCQVNMIFLQMGIKGKGGMQKYENTSRDSDKNP